MPAKFDTVIKPNEEEDKIMKKEPLVTLPASPPPPLSELDLFKIKNVKTGQTSLYQWASLRHMFNAKIENLLLSGKDEVTSEDYIITRVYPD